MATRIKRYEIEITVNGKNYVGDSEGTNMGIALHRAINRWRGRTYSHYDQQLDKAIWTKGPGAGIRMKEMSVKIKIK